MIEISIEYDIVIKLEEVHRLQRGSPGVYIFLDELDKPLYVGIAQDLRTRVESHLNKRTNTKRFAHHFKKIALIHEADKVKRQVAESYLINTLNTPINKNGRYPEGLKGMSVSNAAEINQCQGITNEGKRCLKMGRENGYCHYHSGNRGFSEWDA